LPHRPAAVATLGGGWLISQPGSALGFNELIAEQGGVELGDALTGGEGRLLTIPKSGLYYIALRLYVSQGYAFRANVRRAGQTSQLLLLEVASSATASSHMGTGLSFLNKGDQLFISFNQAARCFHAGAHTELQLWML